MAEKEGRKYRITKLNYQIEGFGGETLPMCPTCGRTFESSGIGTKQKAPDFYT